MGCTKGKLGILVGGGPAPGINGAIKAATIEAINNNIEVLGIMNGFENLIKGKTNKVQKLNIDRVSHFHFMGGSELKTSRANPTKKPGDMAKVIDSLAKLGINYLVTIGGDDTAFAAYQLAKASKGAVRVAHIPKTIDNDLPLPDGQVTFGFMTAKQLGTELILQLHADAKTTERWHFVMMMGRKAGHLALGVGKASEATLSIIPEEFPGLIKVEDVCRILEGAIIKRKILGRPYGTAVIAEGIGEKIDPKELAQIPGVDVEYDDHGHLRLGEVPLVEHLQHEVKRRLKARGMSATITPKTIGYELRCAAPIPEDMDYVNTLGYAAVSFLLSPDQSEKNAGLIHAGNGGTQVLEFEKLLDPTTGRVKVRMVNVEGEYYKAARRRMVRLEKEDFEGPMLKKLATEVKMTPEEFTKEYLSSVTLLN